jgi:thiol:disulfide interchange protein DsbD
MGRRLEAALAAGIALAVTWALLAPAAQAEEAGDLFRVSARLGPGPVQTGGEVRLEVIFDLAEGIHLYKKSISFQWDESPGLAQKEVKLPVPRRMPDPAGGDFAEEIEVYEGTVTVEVIFGVTASPGEKPRLRGKVLYQGCSDDLCYMPAEKELDFTLGPVEGTVEKAPAPASGEAPSESAPDLDFGLLLLKILQAFGIGFLISLTPCVYPMIGITAAILGGTGAGEERNLGRSLVHSLVYVFGISVTYSVFGVLTALAGAPLARFLKTGWVLLPVSGIFLVLALSMFDVITIGTPGWIQNRTAGMGKKGGVAGKLLLGLVSGAVATPCVAAPLIATLLEIGTIASRRGLVPGIVFGLAMLFSLAWGMGIVLIAAGVLTANVLPRSGPWMVWVKKLFGFGMIWAAVYFAQPVIGEPVYDLLTALVLIAAVVFLGGLDRLTRESTTFDRLRAAAGIPVLVMGVLLFVGGVSELTGLFPWLDCGRNASRPVEETPFRPVSETETLAALSSGEPAVLDFYASWCRVCKKLDRETFSDPRVRKALGRVRALKVDFDEAPSLAERFKVVGVPTVVFVGPDGREIPALRFSGFLTAEEFLARLDRLEGEGGGG